MGRKPQPETRLTGNLRIPPELKREIKATAIQRGIYEYQLIEEVWKFWLANRDKVDHPVDDQH